MSESEKTACLNVISTLSDIEFNGKPKLKQVADAITQLVVSHYDDEEYAPYVRLFVASLLCASSNRSMMALSAAAIVSRDARSNMKDVLMELAKRIAEKEFKVQVKPSDEVN